MRSVSILTGVNTHLDHLGVLSEILDIPLIVTEQTTFQLAQQFYPNLNVHLCDYADLSIQYLAEQFDIIFETGKFWAADLSKTMELFFQKKMRFVFCPHGNSDKGHSLRESTSQDLSLFYGQHLLDLLAHNGSLDHIKSVVRTGNYRYLYYLKNKAFYDHVAEEKIFKHFKKNKPLILYAPTWSNSENPSSFFSSTETLIKELRTDFNIAIKLHPFLIEHHPAHAQAIIGRYEFDSQVQFIIDFPPVYPILSKSICYIGDYSSIGYDFLAFNRPLFLLPSNKIESSYKSPLEKCATIIHSENLCLIRDIIRNHLETKQDLYSQRRQETYYYAFGEEKTFEKLHKDIFQSLKSK